MTCANEAALEWPPHPPGAKLDYSVDFTHELVRWHSPGTEFATSTRVRVPGVPGFEFEAQAGGQTGQRPVRWPTVLSGTVVDGSITWIARAVSTSSLKTTISGTPTWACSDAEIVISGTSISGNIATAFLQGGLDGVDYQITVTATFANGASIPLVLTLKCRVPSETCCT